MATVDRVEMNRGMRSVMNVVAVSLFFAYLSAFLLIFFLPLYVVFFIPIVLIYFIAPRFKKSPSQSENSSYRTGRLAGIGIGLVMGISGFIYAFGPVLEAVNSGTVGDGSSIVGESMSLIANVMYLITLLVGYFRIK